MENVKPVKDKRIGKTDRRRRRKGIFNLRRHIDDRRERKDILFNSKVTLAIVLGGTALLVAA